MLTLLGQLCDCDGPPGRESRVVDVLRAHLVGAGLRVSSAPMGGLAAGDDEGSSPRLLLAAFVDEPGLMLSAPIAEGIARAYRLGALPASAYAGQRIRTLRGDTALVLPLDEGSSAEKSRWELRVDLGSASALLPPLEDSFAVLDQSFSLDGQRLTGKALPARAACALLAHLAAEGMASMQGCAIGFICQGQLGPYGLRLALRELAPRAAIVVRGVRHAAQPDAQGSAVRAGEGPVLILRDGSAISHPALVEAVEVTARKAGIDLQRAVLIRMNLPASAWEAAMSGFPVLELGYAAIDADCARQSVEQQDLEALDRLLRALASEDRVAAIR